MAQYLFVNLKVSFYLHKNKIRVCFIEIYIRLESCELPTNDHPMFRLEYQ